MKKFLGAQGPLRPIMALEAPRPLLGAGFYMKKFVAYLNNFQRKKLFCVQTLTKLPELTVLFCCQFTPLVELWCLIMNFLS
jgi:hypothetical protein